MESNSQLAIQPTTFPNYEPIALQDPVALVLLLSRPLPTLLRPVATFHPETKLCTMNKDPKYTSTILYRLLASTTLMSGIDHLVCLHLRQGLEPMLADL